MNNLGKYVDKQNNKKHIPRGIDKTFICIWTLNNIRRKAEEIYNLTMEQSFIAIILNLETIEGKTLHLKISYIRIKSVLQRYTNQIQRQGKLFAIYSIEVC